VLAIATAETLAVGELADAVPHHLALIGHFLAQLRTAGIELHKRAMLATQQPLHGVLAVRHPAAVLLFLEGQVLQRPACQCLRAVDALQLAITDCP